jgi:hypothetical protein
MLLRLIPMVLFFDQKDLWGGGAGVEARSVWGERMDRGVVRLGLAR